ncbi:MAG TPA: hypothetical protein VF601_11495 [Beijerinckiaceae bacterium]|jgi:hypothetical protein
MDAPPGPAFCTDDELGYLRSRTRFKPGAGLALDEAYRLAHLPLVAPRHPGVVPRRDGASYEMGRHPRMFSLVLPVPADALERSPAYRELDRDLRAAPFAGKIAWDLVGRRRDRLHATVCGSLGVGAPPAIGDPERRALAGAGPVAVELRGLFSGNVNVGRLYLKVYPERRDGRNVLRDIQRLLGRPETDLYVVGLHNLLDDLGPAEAAALANLIESWWDRPILRFSADRLWLLGAMDDLVLDAAVADIVRLAPG